MQPRAQHAHGRRVRAHVVAAVGCRAGRAHGEPEAGGARPARVGGTLMPSMYRFFRTFVIMSVWLPGGVLVCGMGMSVVGPVLRHGQ